MKQSFTQNHLVRFLYKETSASETLAIEEALMQDQSLQEAYGELKQAYLQLPKVSFQPSRSTISTILSYSQKTAVGEQA